MSKRFVLEAEWSGYTSSQRHVVHREVLTRDRERYAAINAVRFTDGTCMYVTVRDAKPREQVIPKLGYSEVLHGAARKGLTGSVDVLAC
jgi:hypothetical protein